MDSVLPADGRRPARLRALYNSLHRKPAEYKLPVLSLTLPDLSLRLVRQTYRTVSVNDDGAVINYSEGDFDADLVVDRDGMIIDFPGRARRI